MAKVTSAERRTNLTDATPARNQRLTNVVLWGIAVVYVVGTMFTRILSVPVSLVPLLFPFALIHGAKRYAWNGIVIFVVFTFITINHAWIWTQGGGYFGVPISNFLGWSFTVYIFFQLFAIYLRQRGSDDLSRALPITHYLQIILVYMSTGVGFVIDHLVSINMQVTDAVGHVWQTRDIYETSAISAIYTMIFVSILALVILFKDHLVQKKASALSNMQDSKDLKERRMDARLARSNVR